ncbi:MAG: hypothetical protein J6Q92_05090 [Oscillospiraceae bacterium]|nr:hypothetical protein [Oscillospiraceae bacterium]
MCNNCIHKIVCSKYIATGGVKSCEHHKEERKGRWEDNHCTACGMMPMGEELWEHLDCDPPRMEYFMDYCPTCGADMEGTEAGIYVVERKGE